MMWVLMSVIALAVGFILYSSISDQIPEGLPLPKLKDKGSQVVNSAPAAPVASDMVTSASAWQVRGDGRNVELIRDFQGSIEANGQRYDAPTLVLTCYEGEVFARVNMRMAVASKDMKASVQTPTGAQQWNLGNGHDLYSPTPKSILAAVRAEKPFQLTLPYAELGPQVVTFNPTAGTKALMTFSPECRK
jgi:hypothetical protein